MLTFNKFKNYIYQSYFLGHFPSLSQILINRNRLLAYHGFLGDENFGDELVFEASKKVFHAFTLIPIKRRMPLMTSLMISAGFLQFRGEVLGGGTLIGGNCNLLPAQRSIFLHGTGARSNFSEEWIESFRRKAVYGGVRGKATRAILASKGVEVEVIGDAAFHFFNENRSTSSDLGSILINIGTHNDEEKMKEFRDELMNFVSDAIGNGIRIEFLPMHKVDLELGLLMKNIFPEVYIHSIPQNFAACSEIFARSTFAIGERLHFAVMSLLCGTPCVSVIYDKKHEELLESLGCSNIGVKPNSVSLMELVTRYSERGMFDWSVIDVRLKEFRRRQLSSVDFWIKSL